MSNLNDFDPDSPANIASANAAQTIASAQARAVEGDTLPLPPNNLPALKSIAGTGIRGAKVLGYRIVSAMVNDCIAPDGSLKLPGDEGFLAAQYGRLGVTPMPAGWMFERRACTKLVAIVDGNPILLTDHARALGYARATALSPNCLDLGEIEQ